MAKLTEIERLTVVETKLEMLIEQVRSMDSKLDSLATEAKVASLEEKIKDVETNSVTRKEVFAIVGAVGLAGTILAVIANIINIFGR